MGMGAVLTQKGHLMSLLGKKFVWNYNSLPIMYGNCTLWQYKSGNIIFWENKLYRNWQKELKRAIGLSSPNSLSAYNYLLKLLGYDYIISYKPGKANKVAGSL